MSNTTTPRERFLQICNFERKGDIYFWGVDSWNEAINRWVREGMPVKNINIHCIVLRKSRKAAKQKYCRQ